MTSLPNALRRLPRLLVAPSLALASAALAEPAPLECRWTDVPPVIDGRADEPAWQRATPIGNFFLPWLPGTPRAREGTRVRLLWDRTALYFHAELDDADVTAEVREHDGPLWENDVFELFLKPSPDHAGYFEFEVNPFGAILDAFFPDAESRKDRGQLRRGEFHVEAKVIIHGTLNDSSDRDRGWSVEGRIPWSDFNAAGGRPVPGETWTVNLCRINGRGRTAELSTVAPLAQPSFHRTAEYVPLRFAGPEGPVREAWANPRLHGSPDGPSGYATARAWPRLDLHSPIAVAPEPGSGWLWYLEQRAGREGPVHVGRLRADGDGTGAESLLALDEIAYSLVFHPKYEENGYVFLGVNGPSARAPRFSRVVRYQVRAGRPDPASRTVIIEWPSDGHNGAALAFGRDGLLFVTSGDGSSHSDVHRVGQDPRDLRAKVLRIDPDHPSGGRSYSVPADNPFVDDPRFAPETWAYGLRNPWRLTYDAASDQLWTGENGQDAWEYARLVRRGENYGWSTFEGSHPFIASRPLGPHPVTPPTIEIAHSEFRSLTGGVVYRGRALPELTGAYVFGDYGTGRIWAAKHDGRRLEWMRELIDTPLSLVHVTADANGELVLADYGSSVWGKDIRGGIYRLERAPASREPAPPFPRRLSEAGLFRDVAQQQAAPGVIPYEVNVPGWHDGATGRHWLALPAGGTVEVRAGRVWEVPNGTALVQTLSAGGRKLETRLLLKEGNDWAGYTYLWDDAQRDAVLAGKSGTDLELADGRPWRVPSRAECMMCHSREAGFALTLHEGQLNHGEQLAGWEALGILQVDQPSFERGRRGSGEGARTARSLPGQRRSPRTTLLPRPPAELTRYAPASAADASLEVRARSYLAVNCAHCHVLNGGGNSVMDFQWQVPAGRMRALGEVPQHGDFDVPGARIIAPGDAGRSVLLARVASRGAGQMPPVGTRMPDGEGIRLLVEWIQSLPP